MIIMSEGKQEKQKQKSHTMLSQSSISLMQHFQSYGLKDKVNPSPPDVKRASNHRHKVVYDFTLHQHN